MDRRSPSSPVEISTEALDAAVKARPYLHFDEPFDPEAMRRAVCDQAKVASWQFFPLLEVEIRTKRVKRTAAGKLERSTKVRPICYAGHADSALYAAYAAVYAARYEDVLAERSLCENVIAFRKLGRSNVDFAKQAFEFVASNRHCVALGFDVTNFFGSLDHLMLKGALCELLDVRRLPEDHFAIFRSITRYARVDRSTALSDLGIGKNNPRKDGRTRLCEPAEFRRVIRAAGRVKANSDGFGIPQGTPVSAILSNAYMLKFDAILAKYCADLSGLYLRYCDDILVVVPECEADEAESLVSTSLSSLRLSLQSAKTLKCRWVGGVSLAPPLQYLGLVFDGQRVLLRSGGISRYYAKMRAAVRLAKATKRSADQARGVVTPLRTKKIWRFFSHVGRMSFPGYALEAARRTKSLHIKRQIAAHVKRLRTRLKWHPPTLTL